MSGVGHGWFPGQVSTVPEPNHDQFELQYFSESQTFPKFSLPQIGLEKHPRPTQEAEIRRIEVQSQPGEIVHKTLSPKHPSQKRAGGVAQGVDPKFKLQYCQKKKKDSKGLKHLVK
jgi:hypothetical protein